MPFGNSALDCMSQFFASTVQQTYGICANGGDVNGLQNAWEKIVATCGANITTLQAIPSKIIWSTCDAICVLSASHEPQEGDSEDICYSGFSDPAVFAASTSSDTKDNVLTCLEKQVADLCFKDAEPNAFFGIGGIMLFSMLLVAAAYVYIHRVRQETATTESAPLLNQDEVSKPQGISPF